MDIVIKNSSSYCMTLTFMKLKLKRAKRPFASPVPAPRRLWLRQRR